MVPINVFPIGECDKYRAGRFQHPAPCHRGLNLHNGSRLKTRQHALGVAVLVAVNPGPADFIVHVVMGVAVYPERHTAFLDEVLQIRCESRV